jgi:hypothetical protein
MLIVAPAGCKTSRDFGASGAVFLRAEPEIIAP